MKLDLGKAVPGEWLQGFVTGRQLLITPPAKPPPPLPTLKNHHINSSIILIAAKTLNTNTN